MCKSQNILKPLDHFIEHHSNWKYLVQFALVSGLSVTTGMLAAHIVRFINDYAGNEQYGFTWSTVAIYWSASMWGIGVVVGVFVFCLFIILLIQSRERDIDRKKMPDLIAQGVVKALKESKIITTNSKTQKGKIRRIRKNV